MVLVLGRCRAGQQAVKLSEGTTISVYHSALRDTVTTEIITS